MNILSSCRDSITNCIEQKYFAITHLYSDEKPMFMKFIILSLEKNNF